jgi:hypothetical protein
MTNSRTLVVCLPSDADVLRLPPATRVEQTWVYGGVRRMYEIAFAAIEAGWDVELRGWIDRDVFDLMSAATNTSPQLPAASRDPSPDDVILMPEGHHDPLAYAGAWLSGAQLVLLVLAPLGLSGWPFTATWQRLSPLTARLQDVNRAESLDALAAMGIAAWTNIEPLVASLQAHGVPSAYFGLGEPVEFPNPAAEREVDVAWLTDNRWAPLAERIAQELPYSVDPIPAVTHAEMLRRLGCAKILLYPAQLEGETRIAREARAMGAVPVVVRGANPFSRRLTESFGVLVADSREAMPEAIARLLSDPDRLAGLSARAMQTAREETSWKPFVQEIATALESLPCPDPFLGARTAIGARLREHVDASIAHERVSELELERRKLHDRNVELEAELEKVRTALESVHTALAFERNRGVEVDEELSALRNRRAVRWSLAAADVVRRRH